MIRMTVGELRRRGARSAPRSGQRAGVVGGARACRNHSRLLARPPRNPRTPADPRRARHAAPPPPVTSWLDSDEFDARLSTVESIYRDRGARYPTKPWHDDSYRRCEYSVDWERGTWDVAC